MEGCLAVTSHWWTWASNSAGVNPVHDRENASRIDWITAGSWAATAAKECRVVVDEGPVGLDLRQRGVGRRLGAPFAEHEVELGRERHLNPQGAVVVERRDPVKDRDEVGTGRRHPLDEVEDARTSRPPSFQLASTVRVTVRSHR